MDDDTLPNGAQLETRLREAEGSQVTLTRLGIDTHQEPVIYLRADSPVCKAEGFEAQTRVKVQLGDRKVIATLDMVDGDVLEDCFLEEGEAGLSEVAWRRLQAEEGRVATVSYARPIESVGYIRAKIYGHRLTDENFRAIFGDIVEGRYADVHLAAFLAASGGDRLDAEEVTAMTRAMRDTGETLDWGHSPIVDKHCVGGLPGNRTTPLVVAIVAAAGLTIPKTSSRAITSPAGTADTMGVLTEVDLSIEEIRRVVRQEGGCLAWGGRAKLSPADETLNRVERTLDLDSEGQMVASVLSKKAAAGSTHVVLDVPIGPTAKVRSKKAAEKLRGLFERAAEGVGLTVRVVETDGTEPVGRGIGPALEARDVLAVLRGEGEELEDLRERSILLAGAMLEIGGKADEGEGEQLAAEILDDGRAWRKFRAICEAQGGLRKPPTARFQVPVTADRDGRVKLIDNRRLARVAKLAGAPEDLASGLKLHVRLGDEVREGQELYTIHAESSGERDYALTYLADERHRVVELEEL